MPSLKKLWKQFITQFSASWIQKNRKFPSFQLETIAKHLYEDALPSLNEVYNATEIITKSSEPVSP